MELRAQIRQATVRKVLGMTYQKTAERGRGIGAKFEMRWPGEFLWRKGNLS
jgi:hypothetical protein